MFYCSDIAVEIDNTIDLYDLVRQEHDRRDPEPAFYYRSDHLGSTAYITDENGQVTQTLNYLPYGEDWVDLHGITFDTTRLGMYRFNGKEKDYESGFHYYGARYYWCEVLTGWLSVDPMSDKYPSISPYVYCAWNPVKLVDPDGREVYINGDQADRAVERLQTKKMEITRDNETGKLSVAFRGEYSLDDLSYDERMLYDAIVDENVSVQVTAAKTGTITQNGETIHTFTSIADGDVHGTYGGSFDGTVYLNDRCAISYQFMDLDLLDENGYNQGTPHEVTESYLLGKKTLSKRESIKPAYENSTQPHLDYLDCHERAISQDSPGITLRFLGEYYHLGPRSIFCCTK